MSKRDLSYILPSLDARRRAKVDATIRAFRGDSDRETMVRLAAEVVRLKGSIAVLKEGIEETIAGKECILMPEGPFAEKNKTSQRKRDRSAKWI